MGLTIVTASLSGATLFVTARDDAGRLSRYALDWGTYAGSGQAAVLAAITAAGAVPEQVPPVWVQQLVGRVV